MGSTKMHRCAFRYFSRRDQFSYLFRSRIFQLRFSRKLTFTLIHTKCQHYFFHCGRKRRIFIIVTRNRK